MTDMHQRSALVTGATGFVGTHLTNALLKANWRVKALRRAETMLEPESSVPDGAEVAIYDGSGSSIVEALEDSPNYVVFHLASMISVHHSLDRLESLVKANVLMGTQILEAMTLTGCRSFINTGTFWQNADGPGYNPTTLYAATKQAFESVIEYYRQSAGLSCVTLKLYDTYGPADPRPKLLKLLIRQLKCQEPLAMSPGEQKIDLIHIDDVCSAYLAAAELLVEAPQTLTPSYSIATGTLHSLREIVSILENLTGESLKINWNGKPYRPGEVMTPWIGPRVPGWEPKIALREGLLQLLREDAS